jgi:hypothetical protein
VDDVGTVGASSVIYWIVNLYPLNLALAVLLILAAEAYGKPPGVRHYWPTPWQSTRWGFVLFIAAVILFLFPPVAFLIDYFYFQNRTE